MIRLVYSAEDLSSTEELAGQEKEREVEGYNARG